MRTDRRVFLAMSMAAALAPRTAMAAAPDIKRVRVGKAINSSFPFAGLELGVQKGIWKANGIDIQISSFRGDGQMQQALAAGSIDFGFGSGPGMGYAVKGVPAHAVAAVATRPANMALVAAKNSGVTKLTDLKGKRIGVSTAGSLTDWLARKIAASNGWRREDIEIVPMGEMRTRLAAMRSGDLHAAVTSVQEGYQIQGNGQGAVIATFGEVVPDFFTHVVFAQDSLIAKDPDLVRRVLKGWFTIAAFMRDKREETVKSVAATMRVPEKVVDQTYAIELSMLSFDGTFDPKALEVIRASLKDLGILDSVPPAASLYDGRFVPVALN
jgi:NitT/TauT family transport system substrate-binding protein